MTEIPRKRLCIVAPGHWSQVMGGAQYQTLLLVQRLASLARFHVTYIAKYTGPDFVPADHELVTIDSRSNRTSAMALDGPDLLAALRTASPDIVYYRGGTAYSGIAAYYCRKYGRRSIWHIPSDADLLPYRPRLSTDTVPRLLDRLVFQYCITRSDRVVAQTVDQAALMEQRFGRRPHAVIYNFHPKPTSDAAKSRPPVVLWIGNLKPLKQPEVFLRLTSALSGLTDARFVMIGQMQGSRRWQRRLLKAMAGTPRLEYWGARSQTEVNDALATGSVLVNTSQYEGFSNTFVQAWMRRVPVASLRVNPDGVFADGRLGIVAGSEKQLYTDVLRLVTDSDLRAEIGTRAQKYALDNHSEGNIDRLIEVIEG